jgi:hypothetical protein
MAAGSRIAAATSGLIEFLPDFSDLMEGERGSDLIERGSDFIERCSEEGVPVK